MIQASGKLGIRKFEQLYSYRVGGDFSIPYLN